MGEVEGQMKLGDRALLTTGKKQVMKIVLASKTERHRYLTYEHLHFNAQAHAELMCTIRKEVEANSKGFEEVLSLLSFSYIPLERPRGVKGELCAQAAIQWKQRNTYEKQWRPFTIGVMVKDGRCRAQEWQQVVEEDINEVQEGEQPYEAYYAAWPLQVSIEGLNMSNAIVLTYTHEESWKPESR